VGVGPGRSAVTGLEGVWGGRRDVGGGGGGEERGAWFVVVAGGAEGMSIDV